MRKMKLFVLVASIFAVLIIGCSVPDENTTRLPSDVATANNATADSATATGSENAGTASETESQQSPTEQPTAPPVQRDLIVVIGAKPLRLTTDLGADLDPTWDPRGDIIAFMTSKPKALERPYEIGGVFPNGIELRTLARGPRFDSGIAGELAWIGDTGKLMTNERVSLHEYMTFDTERAPFVRTDPDAGDAAFVRKLLIPGGQAGDGLAVSGDGETLMWMIRTSQDIKSFGVTVRIGELEDLTGERADTAGRALITHSTITQGPDYNRGFSLSHDGGMFVISLKSGDGFDLFLMDSTTGEEIRQLTTNGLSFGEYNLYPEISPDDQRVAFSSQTGPQGRPDIYVVQIDGTGLAKVTDSPDVSEMRPSWSPDGQKMTFQGQDFRDDSPNWDIYAVTLIGDYSGLEATVEASPAQPEGAVDALSTTEPPVGSVTVSHVVSWGSEGTEDGQFDSPRGIAVDTLGRVYVIDSGSHELQTFDSDGWFLDRTGGHTNSKTPGRFLSPNGVAVDQLGNLYVADTGNAQLQAFLTQDEYKIRWQSDFDPAINPFDRSTTAVFNQNYPTRAVATGPNGNVFIAVGGVGTRETSVRTFTSAGIPIGVWGDLGEDRGQLRAPRGVAVDAIGDVYVADVLNHRVLKFKTQGQFVFQIGASQGGDPVSGTGEGEFDTPSGVAVDNAGRLFVSDSGNHRIQVFSQYGEFIGEWGTEGSDDGQFQDPYGLAVDDEGHVYVVDAGNHRIQKFLVSFGP